MHVVCFQPMANKQNRTAAKACELVGIAAVSQTQLNFAEL